MKFRDFINGFTFGVRSTPNLGLEMLKRIEIPSVEEQMRRDWEQVFKDFNQALGVVTGERPDERAKRDPAIFGTAEGPRIVADKLSGCVPSK